MDWANLDWKEIAIELIIGFILTLLLKIRLSP